MKLFLDTEFTDLVPDAKLISIALVDDNENYFYAELTDSYTYEDCSPFVHNYVLPLLRGGDYKMTTSECALKMANWIESRIDPCRVITDAPSWDLPYLDRLLGMVVRPFNLYDVGSTIRVPDMLAEDIVKKFNYQVHNALDDALAMKKAVDYLSGK